MYHSRTKKVASYGRRAHRVVAVTGDRRLSSSVSSPKGSDSDTGDSPCSSAKEIVEDIYAFPSKLPKPRLPLADNKQPRHSIISPNRQKVKEKKAKVKETQIRTPLASYSPNIPNSPAARFKAVKARTGVVKSTPHTLRKVSNASPYVEIDIIVTDGAGRRISEERRMTKTNVLANDINDVTCKAINRPRRSAAVKNYASFASEEEDLDEEYVPSPERLKVRRNVKGATLDSHSRKSNKGTKEPKESNARKEHLPLVDSDSDIPLKPRISRQAVRTIVISDSEPEFEIKVPSDSEGNQMTKEDRKANAVPSGQTTKYTTFKGGQDVTACDSTKIPRGSEDGRTGPRRSSTESQILSDQSRDTNARRETSTDISPWIQINHDLSRTRPRRLTPVRPSRSKVPFMKQPPVRFSPSQLIVLSDDDTSLTIDEELELALHVADLQLAKSSHLSTSPFIYHSPTNKERISKPKTDQPPLSTSQNDSRRRHVPSFLRPLLSECGQLSPFDFEHFIKTFPVDPIVGFSGQFGLTADDTAKDSFHSFRKVGEASYSEVFGIRSVVLKVIPLLDEENNAEGTSTADWDSPPMTEAKDVLKEIVVTRAMGEICKGFIKLLKAHVVQGAYPQILLNLWDKYHKKKGSESVRPDRFGSTQTYAIIILPNGGPDLENFSFSSPGTSGWRQACSVFWQVVRSLGQAEELVQFEHRDLHWGQILVHKTMQPSRTLVPASLGTVALDDPSHGVQSTVIDLGLSRIDQGQGDAFWTPFTDDIFEGEGDYQYDVYRMMRKHNKDEWKSFRPLTNVMWLHYLADRLIRHKGLRSPMRPTQQSRKTSRTDGNRTVAEADKRAYECLLEIDQTLQDSIAPIARTLGVNLRKSLVAKDAAASDSPDRATGIVKSAADVLHLGKRKGWIR